MYAVLHHPEYRQRYAANLRRELPRIPFVGGAITPNGCHSESPRSGGKEPASLPGAGKQQVPHRVSDSARNDIGKDRGGASPEEPALSKRSAPKGAAQGSPGLQSWVDEKKENNSTLPKTVAAERSSQATQIFRAFVKAGQRLAQIHVHY